ncbi:DUF5590 domain-containing protein [Virgibacillus ndiopensis]|uniref:cell wall elongation regulator TseB-like domain-containing protein n=1 Tax=Virgibacillus ndiopensis TaxID=2004408 RepID=UPI00159BB0C6|nr:DUF5590 domain-containing protein [Virgibacillus ndiopensis]
MKTMINKQYSRSIVPKWLKWTFLVLCLVLISCFIYSGFLYHDIQLSKTDGFSQTKKKVLDETELSSIASISRFQGLTEYHVVRGSTKEEEDKLVFVPIENESEKLTIINTKEIISKQNIKEQWQAQCNKCELIEIMPAMVKEKPLWEITYKDNSGRYIFDYLSIYDGERYEQFRLKSMFK